MLLLNARMSALGFWYTGSLHRQYRLFYTENMHCTQGIHKNFYHAAGYVTGRLYNINFSSMIDYIYRGMKSYMYMKSLVQYGVLHRNQCKVFTCTLIASVY